MSCRTEDRCPDVFDLAAGVDGDDRPEGRAHLAPHMAALPLHSAILGHDLEANADFLAKLAHHGNTFVGRLVRVEPIELL